MSKLSSVWLLGEGAPISHKVSRDIKAEFCVALGEGGGGQGAAEGPRISHLVSTYVKTIYTLGLSYICGG